MYIVVCSFKTHIQNRKMFKWNTYLKLSDLDFPSNRMTGWDREQEFLRKSALAVGCLDVVRDGLSWTE